MKYPLGLLIALTIAGCQPVAKQPAHTKADSTYAAKRKVEDVLTDTKGNPISALKVDSMKWLLYAFNKESQAFSYRDRKKTLSSPLQCQLRLYEAKRKGEDTIEYTFAVFYKHPREFYVFYPSEYIGVATINGHISYMLGSYFTTRLMPDEKFLAKEKELADYLKSYKGEMDEWLRKEAVKRKIVP